MPKLDKNTIIGAVMVLGGAWLVFTGYKKVF